MVIAISAYSNNMYAYSSNVVYEYFGTNISGKQLQDLMEQYGIYQTGDSDTDIKALYDAMYADAKNQVNSSQPSTSTNNTQKTQPSNQGAGVSDSSNVPWANLMSQVGLFATGNLTTDYEAFSDKISKMISSATLSQQDRANIAQLIAEASMVFVQPNSSTQASSASAQAQQPAQTVQPISGADIMAQLNKMIMLAS